MRSFSSKVLYASSVLAGAVTFAAGLSAAFGHEAPTGWSYPSNCCSNHACREIKSDQVKETPAGYTILLSGETVPYGDPRVIDSPDGRFHWCSTAGLDNGFTLCLYVPPRAY